MAFYFPMAAVGRHYEQLILNRVLGRREGSAHVAAERRVSYSI
ncbi:hypothetical protein [Cohnella thermotolerans]|nr:hypothetical protein [Cohnella thermotolerans]